jgi:tRNA dimethylallyltransferase
MVAKPLIVIVGETGSGKSELAINLAKKFEGEIVNADSLNFRKGMNIGTAKPSAADRQLITHHLIDIITPDAHFNAADFQQAAKQIIDDIHERHKLPVLVGGSGLYVDSLIYNYSFLDASSDNYRQQLNEKPLEDLIEMAQTKNISLNDEDLTNKRRIIRRIETLGRLPSKQTLRPNTLILGLRIDRALLRQRLLRRLDLMIDQGLEAEVLGLSKRYGWPTEALRAIGYREWQDYFNNQITINEVKCQILKDSLALAKKQRTWFNRSKDINWLTTPVKWNQVVEIVTTYMNNQV